MMGDKASRMLVRLMLAVAIAALLIAPFVSTPEVCSQTDFRWTEQDSGATVHLESVSCVDENDVWALGISDSIKNQILHYDGSGWSLVPSGIDRYLDDIFALNANNVWAVGEDEPTGGSIYHYNGTVWTKQASTLFNYFRAVSACAPNSAWAVGDNGCISRYDGVGWAGQASGTTKRLNDVSALNANNVWAVGDEGTILHYNGTNWSAQPSGTTNYLYGVSALDANHVWAVGDEGTILHYNGTNWSAQPSGTDAWLDDVSAADAGNVWAVGEEGRILHYNGTKWTPQYSDTDAWLIGVDAADAGNVWAVGTYATILYGSSEGGLDWSTWFLAEGCTGGDFETFVLVQNPNAGAVTVDLTFMTPGGSQAGPQGYPIPGNSRQTFKVNDYVTDYSVSTKVVSTGGNVICERAMYGGNRTWAHDSIGVTEPATTWFLAEGCTGGDFETFVLVQNPNAGAVTVDLTFMTPGGSQAGPQGYPIPGNSRQTFKVNDYVTDFSVSTKVVSTGGNVICERAMYGGNRTWAHDSIGVPSSVAGTKVWFLAEGCTGGDFETFVLVQNPNAGAVTVDLTFMTPGGSQAGPQGYPIPGNSRQTFKVNDYVTDFSVSTKVVSTGGDVICERAMYGGNRTWAHDSIGVSSPYSWVWPD